MNKLQFLKKVFLDFFNFKVSFDESVAFLKLFGIQVDVSVYIKVLKVLLNIITPVKWFFYKIFHKMGVTKQKRKTQIIVSLTTYDKRLLTVHKVIQTLLMQTLKPDKLILWLAEDEFKNQLKDLPKKLTKLQKYGLEIKFCKDLKSYKKLIPSLKLYPNDIIITTDDDLYYDKNLVKLLYSNYLENPKDVQCIRARYIILDQKYIKWDLCYSELKSKFLIAIGCGGILYPPKIFDPEIFNEDLFMKLAPHGDDIWFWAMVIKNGKKYNKIENNYKSNYIIGTQENGLAKINYFQGRNDKQFKAVVDYFNLKEVLLNEK